MGIMLTNQRPVTQMLTNQRPGGADTWPDASGDMARVESQEFEDYGSVNMNRIPINLLISDELLLQRYVLYLAHPGTVMVNLILSCLQTYKET